MNNHQKGQSLCQNKNYLNQVSKPPIFVRCGGQSLMEILIGLGVISIMIGASSYALVSVLRSGTVTEQNQSAGLIGNSLLESAFTLAEANWNSIYNLQKTSANHYFLTKSSTTTPTPVAGDESVLEQDIVNGLVGYWKFDENSGTAAYDSSGNGNLGALTNSPTRTASASCKVGSCLSFDGTDDYINTGSDFSLRFTASPFTIVAWINLTDTTAEEIVASDDVTKGYGFLVSSGKLRLVTRGITDAYTDSIASLSTGVWLHVTGVYTGTDGQRILYINGQEDARESYAGTATIADDPLNIGRRTDNFNVFNGFIDDVRIYNRALSAAEVLQLYNSPVYSRYFYVENVNRKACGAGDISTNAATSCTGSANDIGEDPATQKITVGTSWNLKGVSGLLENSVYVTRWVNSVSKQTDWGGSSGTAGAVSDFGTNYFYYSGVSTTTSGSIKVSGI